MDTWVHGRGTTTIDEVAETISPWLSTADGITISGEGTIDGSGDQYAGRSQGFGRGRGRGIRNQVETHLINPLSRSLFDSGAAAGHRYRIEGVSPGASTTIDLVSEQLP